MVQTGSRGTDLRESVSGPLSWRQPEAWGSLQSREARSAGLTQGCRRQEWTQGNGTKVLGKGWQPGSALSL